MYRLTDIWKNVFSKMAAWAIYLSPPPLELSFTLMEYNFKKQYQKIE